MIVLLLTIPSGACGSEAPLAGADLELDREVVVTYDTPDALEGESFVVRAWSEQVVRQRTRFSVDLDDHSGGVIQDTCEDALAMAAEMAANLDTTSTGECVERMIDVTARFHEVRIKDATGRVTLRLSSEATSPYVVNVILDTDDEQSGCDAIGTVIIEPDQERVDFAVDVESYACDGD